MRIRKVFPSPLPVLEVLRKLGSRLGWETATAVAVPFVLWAQHALAGGAAEPLWIGLLLAGALQDPARTGTRKRSALRELHRHIVEAQDGCLRPVDRSQIDAEPGLEPLINDYNQMIASLRSTFNYVEECQNRVLAERNKMNALLQSLPGALLSVDENLQINTVNRQAEDLMQGSGEDLVGCNLFDLLALNEGDRSLLRDAFLYKRPVRNQEIHLELGEEHRALSLNLSFLSQEDTDMAAVITLQDITEYKHLQDSIYTREKLVAMGQLAAGVAHELNTPLGNILGYSQLMESALDNPQKLAYYSGVIADETKQCSRIVQDLLNYARKDQCMGDTCELNNLIQEVYDTFVNCRLKRHKVEFALSLTEELPEVEGGCGELDIVLTNLILNAIQALKRNPDPRIVVRTWQDSPGLVGVAVEDNGPGVPPELRSRIFDPFFTTKEVGDGSGLGLSISHAMVSKRGGTLICDPEVTEGARFVLKLTAGKSDDGPSEEVTTDELGCEE